MEKKIISLSKIQDLKIFMSPVRQKIIRHMKIKGSPMTAKALADSLGLSPSSAKHHISKLESLGIVELSHTELINGIKARYYKPAEVLVNIGSQLEDDLSTERNIIVQNLINSTLEGLNSVRELDVPQDELQTLGDFVHGVVHLTPEDSKKLFKLMQDFIDTHETKSQGTEPWEYAFIFYNAGAKK